MLLYTYHTYYMSEVHENRDSRGQSINMDKINPKVAEVLHSLHLDNDGQVTINDAIQGIIMLQRQTRNYRRLAISIFVVALIVLFCTFGAAMLAIKLNKDMKTKGDVITDMQGDVLRTGIDLTPFSLRAWISADDRDPTQLTSFSVGDATVHIQGTHLYDGGIILMCDFFTINIQQANSTITLYEQFSNHTDVRQVFDYMTKELNIKSKEVIVMTDSSFKRSTILTGLSAESIILSTGIRPKSLIQSCQPGFFRNSYGQCVKSPFLPFSG